MRKKNFNLWIEKACLNPRTKKSSVNLLHIAAWAGSISMIQLAKEQGLSLNDAMDDGTSALAIAASHGHCEVAQFFLDHSVNINMIDRDLKSPLDQAASHNHIDIVRLLIKAGAPVNLERKPERARGVKRALTRRQSAFVNASEIEVARELIPLASDEMEIGKALDQAATWGRTDWVDMILTSP